MLQRTLTPNRYYISKTENSEDQQKFYIFTNSDLEANSKDENNKVKVLSPFLKQRPLNVNMNLQKYLKQHSHRYGQNEILYQQPVSTIIQKCIKNKDFNNYSNYNIPKANYETTLTNNNSNCMSNKNSDKKNLAKTIVAFKNDTINIDHNSKKNLNCDSGSNNRICNTQIQNNYSFITPVKNKNFFVHKIKLDTEKQQQLMTLPKRDLSQKSAQTLQQAYYSPSTEPSQVVINNYYSNNINCNNVQGNFCTNKMEQDVQTCFNAENDDSLQENAQTYNNIIPSSVPKKQRSKSPFRIHQITINSKNYYFNYFRQKSDQQQNASSQYQYQLQKQQYEEWRQQQNELLNNLEKPLSTSLFIKSKDINVKSKLKKQRYQATNNNNQNEQTCQQSPHSAINQ